MLLILILKNSLRTIINESMLMLLALKCPRQLDILVYNLRKRINAT